MLIQNTFENNFRHKFDLIMPQLQSLNPFYSVQDYIYWPSFSPARRKYFISYLGRIEDKSANNLIKKSLLKLSSSYNSINHNEFLFDFDCDEKTQRLCANQTIILLESTFTLLLPPDDSTLFNEDLNQRLFNCLSTGKDYFFFK